MKRRHTAFLDNYGAQNVPTMHEAPLTRPSAKKAQPDAIAVLFAQSRSGADSTERFHATKTQSGHAMNGSARWATVVFVNINHPATYVDWPVRASCKYGEFFRRRHSLVFLREQGRGVLF